MISLSIRNCPDKNLRTLLKDASYFFISSLLPNIRNLNVTIRLSKTLLSKEKISASCGADDDLANNRYHVFTILIEDSLNEVEKLSVLAHEFAHVKQYASGELQQDSKKSNISIWKGKRYDDEKVPYEKHPWEIDARKIEEKLLNEYLRVSNINNLKC